MDLLDDPLVSVDWLDLNIKRADVKILDGTWLMPGEKADLPQGFIPGAQVFDVDEIASPHPTLKHMLPNTETFIKAVSSMGIHKDDIVVVYDRHGVRTAPRVWWTFKAFGHDNVYVLDGGLPAWIRAGEHVSDTLAENVIPSEYSTSDAQLGVTSQSEILKNLGSEQIIDARSSGRFYGTAPEPRAGLASGHIPGSYSLPISDLWTDDGYFKSLPEVTDIVSTTGIELSKPIITTCGSGITAAGLALNLYRLGAVNISVYDGSWAEWGASDAPVSLKD